MAGTGTKLFLSGEIAYASDVNTFLMDQVIARFATEVARDSAFGDGYPATQTNPGTGLPGSGKPALTEGRFCYIDDTNDVQYYDGTEWQSASQFTVGNGTITTEKLDGTSGSEAVTTAKIRTSAITTDKLDGTSGSEAVTTAKIRTGAVTSDKILNGTIVNADISDSAAIALSKLATGELPSGITISSANVPTLTIETADIADDAVTSDKLGSSLTLTGTTTLSGTTNFQQIVEKATTDSSTVLSSTATNIDVLSGAVYRFTSASHTTGFKLNIRGDDSNTLASLMTANSQAVTVAISVVSGGSAISFAASDYLTIDTSATVTIKWFGGTKPSGNASSEDFYTFTIFKTGSSAFTVFASQSKFA